MKSVIFLSLYTLFLMEVLILPPKVLAISKAAKVNAIADYPYMCGIYRHLYKGSMGGPCGCAIISPKYALTAAHCFYDPVSSGSAFTFFVGSVNFNSGVRRTLFKDRDVIIHPNYNKTERVLTDSNLAIIKINPELYFTDNIKSIRLAGPDDCFAIDGENMLYPLNNLDYTITGWGDNSSYGLVNRTFIWKDSSDNYRGPLLWGKAHPERRTRCEDLLEIHGYNHEENICTSKPSNAIFGDDGGPYTYRDTSGRLEYSKNNGFFLCGIIAHDLQFVRWEEDYHCTIYMRVSYYMEWICETTNNEADGCKEYIARKDSCVFYDPL